MTVLRLSRQERDFADNVARLLYCNPFLPDRITFERACLGAEFVDRGPFWSRLDDLDETPANVSRILARVEAVLAAIATRARTTGAAFAVEDLAIAAAPETASLPTDLVRYHDLAVFCLYHRHRLRFGAMHRHPRTSADHHRAPFFAQFRDDHRALFSAVRLEAPDAQVAHLFALCFQVSRAFHHVFETLIGGSLPAARLRAAVWQSVFTHDMRRYRRVLHDRMQDFTCLITGPTGSGKELVARAIAFSQYLPFDARTATFGGGAAPESFLPVNLSALSATLIESELFGHRRGSFTGALRDHAGYLETCPRHGAVFLDEIGELDLPLQVKLLRVLQDRTFARIGDTRLLPFRGKIIAATNRDLPRAIAAGDFRADLYYRLCADVIATESLRAQLDDAPQVMETLVRFVARRLVGEAEAPALAEEATTWIARHVAPDYAWPGNVRELEQCVRNVLIRRDFSVASAGEAAMRAAAAQPPRARLAARIERLDLTADELLAQYCTLVYAQAESYQEAARRLGIDHRTLKARLDARLLDELGAA